MKGCRQFLGVLVAMGLVITAVLALLLVNLAQVITNRDIMKQALNLEQLFQEVGPELILNGLQVPDEVASLIPEGVDVTAVQTAMADLIPPDWLNQQAEGAVDDVYDFLETGAVNQTGNTEVDLRPIVQRLRTEPGRNLIATTLNSLPPCPDPQPTLDLANLNIPNCLPTQVPVEQVTDVVHTAVIQTLDANAPLIEANAIIHVPLLTPQTLTPQQWQDLQRAQRLFTLADEWAWLLWLPPLFCLLVLLLIGRSVGEWGHWWGWPLLLTGVVSLFMAAVLPAVVLAQVRLALPNTFGTLQPTVNQIAQDLATQVVDIWLQRVYLQAGLTLGGGVILLGIGFLFYRRPPQSWQK
ncbi:MAG: hypothetical protein H6658_13150 [Ardenticatenaceae bacterium]|nr:hypothetical protein [Ardenticatenaceae bacterium]